MGRPNGLGAGVAGAVKLVDGTGISMPDTQQNEARFPQPSTQAKGVGFPMANLVVVICLATGAALEAAVGAHGGKGSGELALFRQLARRTFTRDDVIACRCSLLQLLSDRRD